MGTRSAKHLLHIFPTFSVGGVQNRIVRVINALNQRFHHTILAMDGDFSAANGLERHLDVTFESVSLRKSRFFSVANLTLARHTLRRLRPNLLLSYNWGSMEWILANRISRTCPQIHFESGFGPDELPESQYWRRVVMRRILLRVCQRVVVPSATLYEVANRIWHLEPERILYLPNGIDTVRFARGPDAAVLSSLKIPDNVPVVGTVTPLRPEKNLQRLIRVFAALPHDLDTRLIVVGGGPEENSLKSAAANFGLGGRVVFAGPMDDPSQILGRFNVFALTSDTEQMPNSILEAMAAGVAIAATDVGDVRRMLATENAEFVVHASDEKALSNALERLLRDPSVAKQIAEANRARVRAEYSLEAMVSGYDALYSSVV